MAITRVAVDVVAVDVVVVDVVVVELAVERRLDPRARVTVPCVKRISCTDRKTKLCSYLPVLHSLFLICDMLTCICLRAKHYVVSNGFRHIFEPSCEFFPDLSRVIIAVTCTSTTSATYCHRETPFTQTLTQEPLVVKIFVQPAPDKHLRQETSA